MGLGPSAGLALGDAGRGLGGEQEAGSNLAFDFASGGVVTLGEGDVAQEAALANRVLRSRLAELAKENAVLRSQGRERGAPP